MSIFVGVTPQEVGQIEVAVREFYMKSGVDTSNMHFEARNVYREEDNTYTASVIVTKDLVPAGRSTYTLVYNGIFEVVK